MKPTTAMSEKIVSTAEALIQARGYHAFSYRDIAKLVGIKTASIHYYFPAKEDLVREVVAMHLIKLQSGIDNIFTNPSMQGLAKIKAVIDTIFALTYHDQSKMCLGGILAAEVLTLPKTVQIEIKKFFRALESKIANYLETQRKHLHLRQDSKTVASLIFALVEGTLLMARLFEDEERITHMWTQIERLLIK